MGLSQQHERNTTRSALFYWDSVIFLVEDALFKVPRYRFEQSSVFRATFTLAAGVQSAEGGSEENPFELLGITETAFESFLKVMYRCDTDSERHDLTKEDWVSALRLSTMWDFLHIRTLSITKLSKIDMKVLDKILLAKEFKVAKWLIDGYHDFAKRSETMAVDDAQRLGWETTARLLRVREAVIINKLQTHLCFGVQSTTRGTGYCSACNRTFDFDAKTALRGHDFTRDLRTEFATELKELENLSHVTLQASAVKVQSRYLNEK